MKKGLNKDKNFSSILSLDERVVAALPFGVWLIYHLMSSLIFFLSVTTSNIDLFETLFIYINNCFSFVDLVIALITLCFYFLEKSSRLVKYYMLIYLTIDLFLPLFIALLSFGLAFIPSYFMIVIIVIIFGLLELILMALNFMAIYHAALSIRIDLKFLSFFAKKCVKE